MLKFDHDFSLSTYRLYVTYVIYSRLLKERDALVYVGIDVFILVPELIAVVRPNWGPPFPGRSALAALVWILNLVALAERPRVSPYAVHCLLIAHHLAYLLVGMLTIRKHIDLYDPLCVGHVSGSESPTSRDCLRTMTVYVPMRTMAASNADDPETRSQTLPFFILFSPISKSLLIDRVRTCTFVTPQPQHRRQTDNAWTAIKKIRTQRGKIVAKTRACVVARTRERPVCDWPQPIISICA